MREFNLIKEKIVVEKKALMFAINTHKLFGITIEGQVIFDELDQNILIYKGSVEEVPLSGMMHVKGRNLSDIFGKFYKIEEDDESVIFDAHMAWQDIVLHNVRNATYDDSTSDGIIGFSDEVLEDMSWHSVEFGITNRYIADEIEKSCDGILFSLHRDEPFHFSALGYIKDIECAREITKKLIVTTIKEKIENDPEFKRENLTDDEVEAAEYFGVL